MRRRIVRIAVGIVVIKIVVLTAVKLAGRFLPSFGGQTDDVFAVAVTIGGTEFHSTAPHLAQATVNVLMGGVLIDLRRATPARLVDVEVGVCMGGAKIVVPDDWRVTVASRSLLGGIANDTTPDEDLPPDAAHMRVSARAVFGGVQITTRR